MKCRAGWGPSWNQDCGGGRGNINNLRYAEYTTLMTESKEELKNLLKKVKEEHEKVGLKLNIQKTKIIASGPITSWQIDGETMETVTDFILGGLQNHCRCDCSHEIKRRLFLGRKAMTNLDSILKSRDITLLTKVCLVKAMVFSSHHIWMWELDHKKVWAPKNWCFQTVVLEKTFESCLDCKEIKAVKPKGNQSWIFIGGTDAEASNLWPPDAKSQLMENTLMLGKIEGRRRRGWQRTRWLDGITNSMHMSWTSSGRWWRTGKPGMLQSMGSQRVGHDWVTEQQGREIYFIHS